MTKTTVQKDGFEGILYPGNGRKDKVLIVMSGSDGGMKLTKQEAGFYHENGFPALALALFKTSQTPKELSRVPVEYVERAIAWLKACGYEKTGIDGTSKGSEMALVAASMFPELSCVIVRVPSHFVSEGLSGSGKNKAPSGTSCWSYRGEELPYAPYRSRSFNIMEMFMREKERQMTRIEAIKMLELIKRDIQQDYPMDYQIALDIAMYAMNSDMRKLQKAAEDAENSEVRKGIVRAIGLLKGEQE